MTPTEPAIPDDGATALDPLAVFREIAANPNAPAAARVAAARQLLPKPIKSVAQPLTSDDDGLDAITRRALANIATKGSKR